MAEKPDSSKNAVSAFVKQTATQMSALVDCLEEPQKSQFMSVKKEWDTILAGMPPTDMVPAAREANWSLESLWNCLYSLQNAMGLVGSSLNSMKSKYASAIPAEEVQKRIGDAVTAEVDKRIKEGALFPADRVTQLCSDAKANVEKTLRAEFSDKEKQIRDQAQADVTAAANRVKLISTRSTLLASEKVPLPGEDVLGLADEGFNAKRALAQSRMEKLTKAGATDGELLASAIWLDEDQYLKQEKIILKALECATRSAGIEPFALPPSGAGTAGKGSMPSF